MNEKTYVRFYKDNTFLKGREDNNQADYYLIGGGDLPGPGGPQNCVKNR